MILTAVIVPSAMSAALIALLAIDAEVILDNGMTLFILYSVYVSRATIRAVSAVIVAACVSLSALSSWIDFISAYCKSVW